MPNAPESEQKDTVLHEIAHALDFEERGTSDHGPRWKAIARRVGATPTRCGSSGLDFHERDYKYEIGCENGCWKRGAYRKGKRIKRMQQAPHRFDCKGCEETGTTYVKQLR